MSCLLTSGIQKDCKSQGGINRVYLASLTTGFTYTFSGDTVNLVSGLTFYSFTPNKNTADLTVTVVGNVENNSVGYDHKLSASFGKLSATKRNTYQILTQSNTVAIVELMDGSFWMAGYVRGFEATGGSFASGKALTDMSGLTIELSSQEGVLPIQVDSTSFTVA
jgi:hypothetical protein